MADWFVAALPCLAFALVLATPLLCAAASVSKPRKHRYSQWIE